LHISTYIFIKWSGFEDVYLYLPGTYPIQVQRAFEWHNSGLVLFCWSKNNNCAEKPFTNFWSYSHVVVYWCMNEWMGTKNLSVWALFSIKFMCVTVENKGTLKTTTSNGNKSITFFGFFAAQFDTRRQHTVSSSVRNRVLSLYTRSAFFVGLAFIVQHSWNAMNYKRFSCLFHILYCFWCLPKNFEIWRWLRRETFAR
jgi:hypothetical protein